MELCVRGSQVKRILVLIFLISFSTNVQADNRRDRIRRVSEYYAQNYAASFKLPRALVLAIIDVESGWNPLGGIAGRGHGHHAADAGHGQTVWA